MSLWEQWRPWIRQQRSLLRELILMLLAMLVVGIYFLEHYSASLEQERAVQRQRQMDGCRQGPVGDIGLTCK